MTRKISETFERDCCDPTKDIVWSKRGAVGVCRHCGDLWTRASRGDGAGGQETVVVRVLEFHVSRQG